MAKVRGAPAKPPLPRSDTLAQRARGAWVWDARGKQLLDLTSGATAGPLGHQHADVVAASARQASDLTIFPPGTTCTAAEDVARELTELTALPHVALADSPAGARDLALAAMSRDGGRVIELTAPDEATIEAAFGNGDLRGVLLDPAGGASGVEILSGEAGRTLSKLCRRYGAALAVDETRTGLGRTGRVWAHEHAGLAPDLLVGVDGLGGGLPIGFCATRERMSLAVVLPTAPACAAASALVRVFRGARLWKAAEQTGHDLCKRLRELGAEVSGSGLHLAVRAPTRLRGDPCDRLRDEGALVVPARSGWLAVRLPLMAGEVEIRETVDAFARVLGPAK